MNLAVYNYEPLRYITMNLAVTTMNHCGLQLCTLAVYNYDPLRFTTMTPCGLQL